MSRVTFASKMGLIAAAAGSAVGLGNIWRFPSETAAGGGALFIIIYLACIFFFGIPLMLSEFIVGRSSKSNAAGAFRILAPNTKWNYVGRLGVFSGLVILGFYMVVCGWTLFYIFQSVTGGLSSVSDFSANFETLLQNPLKQWILTVVFTFMTAFFVVSGVKKGIELSAKTMMPLLLLLLIILAVRSLTLPGASAGIDFLFKPKLENMHPSVLMSAMGQSFFSLSLGMACMITYASYFNNETDLTKTAFQVSILDTGVALLAGITIFPAAFALAQNSETITSELIAGGPGLLFITLPNLFNQMPLSIVWSTIFFVLLAIAALTSTISLMEVVTAYIHEEFNLSRFRSVLIVTIVILLLGAFSSFSSLFFNTLDFISAKIMLPIGGLFTSLFVGWYVDKKIVFAQLTNDNKISIGVRFLKAYVFILRYLAPVAILVIFIYGLWGSF
ncbi:MAG: sodium-dependent transporter [Porphyromonadaceae bacterium]|nr:sodium-dependent transporter [Porphyromonadaceae bacterium]